MALLPYSLEQVDEQLTRFGEEHAELRAEVRYLVITPIGAGRAARRGALPSYHPYRSGPSCAPRCVSDDRLVRVVGL